jgi:DNA-binding beta-propeller fold protein YncE
MSQPYRALAGVTIAILTLGTALAAEAAVVVVLNSGDASVSVIDPVSRTETRRFEVGKEPHHLMATPDGRTLIVANAASNDLVFLDPATGGVQRRVRNIPDPYQIGFSPDKRWFVVAGNRLNRIDVYAANGGELKLVRSLSVSKTPSHIAFSADSQYAFVTLQDSNEIAAVRLADQSLLWKVRTGEMPAGIWMTPDDRHLLIGMTGADYVEVFDWRSRSVVKRIRPARVRTISGRSATGGICSFPTASTTRSASSTRPRSSASTTSVFLAAPTAWRLRPTASCCG